MLSGRARVDAQWALGGECSQPHPRWVELRVEEGVSPRKSRVQLAEEERN